MPINKLRSCGKKSPFVTAVIVLALAVLDARGTALANPMGPTTESSSSSGQGTKTAPESRPAAAQPSTDETYAAREASAKDLENFRGGDVVIIGSGGLVILLLVILLVLLL